MFETKSCFHTRVHISSAWFPQRICFHTGCICFAFFPRYFLTESPRSGRYSPPRYHGGGGGDGGGYDGGRDGDGDGDGGGDGGEQKVIALFGFF